MNYSNMNRQRVPWLELLWLTTCSSAKVKISKAAFLSALGGAVKRYSLSAPVKLKLALSLRENGRAVEVEEGEFPAFLTVAQKKACYQALKAACLSLPDNDRFDNLGSVLPNTFAGIDTGAFSVSPLDRPRIKPYTEFDGKIGGYDFLSDKDTDSLDSWKHMESVHRERDEVSGYARHLEKLLDERNYRMREQEEEIAKLRTTCKSLQAEKNAVEGELTRSFRERDILRRLNSHLEVRCFEAESENEVLRRQMSHLSYVGEVAAEAMEASLLLQEEREREREREMSRHEEGGFLEVSSVSAIQQEALTRTIAVALESLEVEREKEEAMADKLQRELAMAAREMEERDMHLSWLVSSLTEVRRREAQTEKFLEEMKREREGESGEGEVSSHSELEAVLEAERKRYVGQRERLEREEEAVRKEKDTATSHTSSLEQSLERVGKQALGRQLSARKLQNAIQLAHSPPRKTLNCHLSFQIEMPKNLFIDKEMLWRGDDVQIPMSMEKSSGNVLLLNENGMSMEE